MTSVKTGLAKKKLFLFDIDGTLALDSTLLPGTRELLSYIEEIGGKAVFITNNSTKSRRDYVQKFEKWGFSYGEDHFLTATYVTCRYLKKNHEKDLIYLVGTNSLRMELEENGFRVTENPKDDANVALIGFDNEFHYQKAWDLCELLARRPEIPLLGTNPDLRCPTSFGFVPDCGAICKMLACATDREPKYLGKPDPGMVEVSLEQTGFTKEETLVVGDRLYTDIACGIAGGVDTAVVFTGEAQPEDLKTTEFPPTYAFENVMELYREILKNL